MATILKVFTNEADGIESQVVQIDKGYSVTLKDTDANQYVAAAIIYPFGLENAYDRAIAKAQSII